MRTRKRLIMSVVLVAALGVVATSVPAGAASRLETELDGSNEVPGPGDPDGSGVARVRLNVKAGRVCYAISVTDIVLPATGAHIHRGGVSDAGPVKVALNNPTEVGTSGIGLASGCEEAKTKLLRRIRANPQRFYVNVHTTDYQDGAVRGQLG
jgi:hypothetical protein